MNILITGADGFIASNIIKKFELNKSYKIFKCNRQLLNLHSQDEVKKFISDNSINHIIHCAIEGGMRLIADTDKIVYNNINMIQNLLSCKIPGTFINIASGSEFDRRRDIFNFKENELYNSFPIDYYGLSKNIIAKLINNTSNGFNLRLFGCFNYNEDPSRMIRTSLNNYFTKNPIIIHQDKYMDFLYVDDLITLITNIYDFPEKYNKHQDINVVYLKKYKLSDIANMINELDIHKVPVIIKNKNLGLSYCGNGNILDTFNLEFKGIKKGLQECYRTFYEY